MRRYIHGIYSDVIDQFWPFCHADWSFFVGKIAVFAIFLHIKYIK